jgi:hypothetical protein
MAIIRTSVLVEMDEGKEVRESTKRFRRGALTAHSNEV